MDDHDIDECIEGASNDERIESLSDDDLDDLILRILTEAGPEGISTADIQEEIHRRLKLREAAFSGVVKD